MFSSVAHVPHFHRICGNQLSSFLPNPVNKQTNKQTNDNGRMMSLAEVVTAVLSEFK